ncbi:unnamed protein product [Anisakis simplex]|uniref:THUMP domain-containing protein n=1 Tax=Anisakis simplex TaxID=6269 RepID=A0A0M3J910_ANISI|nr:unnamed protein product [Anisakis simplex]
MHCTCLFLSSSNLALYHFTSTNGICISSERCVRVKCVIVLQGPLQLLVRRMTRFCVTVGIDEAMERIIEVCEASGFDAKKRGHNWLTVSDRREMSFMVTIYEMGSHATKKVMVDFRRSRGDGLEFKRAFIALKEKLDLIVCKEGTDWLERLGLVCSQALHQLSVN